MTRGFGSMAVERVGEIVREILMEHGELYGQQMFRMVKERTGRKKGTYASFMSNYINKLSKLGAIKRTRTEPSSNPALKDRQYWSIEKGKELVLDLWRDPQKAWKERI